MKSPRSTQSANFAPAPSPWSPLQNALFRSMWIATIVSNVGTWMQDVGAGWLMTSLSSSPSLVALIEAADSIPVMLLALPAGALADIVDRRRLLIAIQIYLLVVAGALGILAVLVRWKREHHKSALPAERFFSAMRVGMRFVMHTRALQTVLVRGIAFFVFASATWSLFPLIVRRELGRGPEVYGLLLTCIGVGAVAGALLLPRVRARVSRDTLVAGASALYAVAALALAYVQNIGLLAIAMLATGVAWISILSALQVAAQMTLPPWVRARGLAAFVVVFMGGMALGSILWGQVATRIGIPAALTVAAAGMLVAIALTLGFKLGHHEVLNFTPTMDWAPPLLAETPELDSGPVLVTIAYRIRPDKRAEFVTAMQEVGEMRRRNGAYFWQLFHDTGHPARFVECFTDESWLEHLRQHERVSVADREIQRRAKQYLVEGETTTSSHWLAEPGS